MGFPADSDGKEQACNAGGDPSSIHEWRRSPGEGKRQPTPVFLLGKSQGQRSLVGCSPRGCRESDTTERLTQTHTHTYTQVVVGIRKWQHTPVLLPGESHGLGSLAGYSLWGRKESDTTKRLIYTHTHTHTQSITLHLSEFLLH